MENQEIAWLLQEKYNGVKTVSFEADCSRLAAGEPLGYLIGHVPFLNCTIHLDSHPLIPRVETEFWVEKAIIASKTHLKNQRGPTPLILDLCSGSGAIGVAVAKGVPEALVTFTELDPLHLPTIEKNLSENIPEWSNRSNHYCITASDLFEQITEEFDFILTNPPYIDAAAGTVDMNVTTYEPHLALFGGDNGMDIITRIIAEAPQHLTPAGQLWIEHEPAQVEAITALALNHGFTIVTHPDQYDIPRFSVLTMAQ